MKPTAKQLLPDADGTSDATADANAEKDPASAVPAGASSRRVTNLSLASTGGKEPEQPQQQREQVFSYPVYGWKLIQHPVSAKQLEDARVASGGAPAADAQAAEAEQTMQDLLQAIGDDDDALNLDEEGSVPRDWQMVDKFRDEGPLQEREYPISEFAPGEDPFFGSAISHVTPRPGADGGPPSVMDKLNAELGVSEK